MTLTLACPNVRSLERIQFFCVRVELANFPRSKPLEISLPLTSSDSSFAVAKESVLEAIGSAADVDVVKCLEVTRKCLYPKLLVQYSSLGRVPGIPYPVSFSFRISVPKIWPEDVDCEWRELSVPNSVNISSPCDSHRPMSAWFVLDLQNPQIKNKTSYCLFDKCSVVTGMNSTFYMERFREEYRISHIPLVTRPWISVCKKSLNNYNALTTEFGNFLNFIRLYKIRDTRLASRRLRSNMIIQCWRLSLFFYWWYIFIKSNLYV